MFPVTSYKLQLRTCYLLFNNHGVHIYSIYVNILHLCKEVLQVVQTTGRLCLVRASWSVLSISHIQVLFFFAFSNSTHKTKTGTAHWSESTISNPPGPIKLSSQSAAGWCYALLCQPLHPVANAGPKPFCCAMYQPLNPVENAGPKPFSWAKLGMLCLSFIQFSFARATYWAQVELLSLINMK